MKLSESSSDDEDFGIQTNGGVSTDSIAKGVFVFKRKNVSTVPAKASPKKKARRKPPTAMIKESNPDQEDESSFEFFGLEKSGLGEFEYRSDRFRNYKNLCQTIVRIMAEQQKDIFGKVLGKVTNFARLTTEERSSAMDNPADSNGGSIPTCVLLTGVNLPDHNDMFCLLKQNLASEISPHVATLKSASCPNLRTLVMQSVAQLAKKSFGPQSLGDGSDSEGDEDGIEMKSRASYIGSFSRLKTWYENQYQPVSGAVSARPVSTKKSSKKKSDFAIQRHERPPLIIILEDFEAFPPLVLQHFIQNVSMYSNELPFVLIFGVATTVDAVHRSLPHSVTSLLAMQKLMSEPSIGILDRFFRSVVTSQEIPFKLGSKIIQAMFENFALVDLSVKNILTTYQWSLLEHFSGCPTSVACVSDSSTRRKLILNKISDQDLDQFKRLKSFKKLVESNPEKHVELLIDTKKFRTFLSNKIEILWQRTETFNIFVGCLHAIAADLPGTMGQYFYSVYCNCMSEPVTQTAEYRRAFAFLKISERKDLIKRLQSLEEYLKDYSSQNEDAKKAYLEAKRYLEELESFDGLKSPQKFESSSPQVKRSLEFDSLSSPKKQSSVNGKHDFESRASPRKQAVVANGNLDSPVARSSPRKSATPGSVKSPRKRLILSPEKEAATPPTASATTTPSSDVKKPKFSRHLFQQNMLQEAKEKSRQESASSKNPFVDLRNRIIQFLHKTFDQHLGAGPTSCIPSEQVFYEVQYFDDITLMKDHLIGDTRQALETALQDPFFYLENPDLKMDNTREITAALPDLCIAYKLLLENSRYVNLYDWFQCWLSIASSSTSEDDVEEKRSESKQSAKKGKKKAKHQTSDDEAETEPDNPDESGKPSEEGKLQARFSRAVSELQFLGYIRPSKRKTDHVERLALHS